ncbi:MAG: hypothetical protein IJP97_04855 [Synergistaceae bacterium]|nr:hypothetical protein [Synergistaceae bacterium]MBQ9628353.1 hypothetical protein [Synergistaceae bacterium]MBR0069806.1 hypothetical protein [Synergistaceae bacterium]MBR0251703.1 hypothetical protein [Synergistaceae bacterium]
MMNSPAMIQWVRIQSKSCILYNEWCQSAGHTPLARTRFRAIFLDHIEMTRRDVIISDYNGEETFKFPPYVPVSDSIDDDIPDDIPDDVHDDNAVGDNDPEKFVIPDEWIKHDAGHDSHKERVNAENDTGESDDKHAQNLPVQPRKHNSVQDTINALQKYFAEHEIKVTAQGHIPYTQSEIRSIVNASRFENGSFEQKRDDIIRTLQNGKYPKTVQSSLEYKQSMFEDELDHMIDEAMRENEQKKKKGENDNEPQK